MNTTTQPKSFMFVTTVSDRKTLRQMGFDDQNSVFMSDPTIESLDITSLTKTQLAMHKAMSLKAERTADRTKKLQMPVPKFSPTNIRNWLKEYAHFLIFESLQNDWYRYLALACS